MKIVKVFSKKNTTEDQSPNPDSSAKPSSSTQLKAVVETDKQSDKSSKNI